MKLGEPLNKTYDFKCKGSLEISSTERVWIGKRKLFWSEVIGAVTPINWALTPIDPLHPEKGYYWIDITTNEKVAVPLTFSVKELYTRRKLLDTFAHLKGSPTNEANTHEATLSNAKPQMSKPVHCASEYEYIEHKPTGAGRQESGAPPQSDEPIEEVDFWKYAPSPAELKMKKYSGLMELFKDYGFRPIKVKEADLKYYKDLPKLEVPFMADLPEPEKKLLEAIYSQKFGEENAKPLLKERTYFKPFFRVRKTEEGTKLEVDRVNAGKYHIAYSISQSKDYAKRKLLKLLKLGREILKDFITVRDNAKKLWWEETKLIEKYINEEISEREFKNKMTLLKAKMEKEETMMITNQYKLHTIMMTFTIPKAISEYYQKLYTTNRKKFWRLDKALEKAHEKTLYKIAYYQLKSEGLFPDPKEEKPDEESINEPLRELKKKIGITAMSQKHITSSAYYGKEDLLFGEEPDYTNKNDPFTAHVHFHDIMLNAVKITAPEPILDLVGVPREKVTYKVGRNEITREYYVPFYRINPHLNANLVKQIWRDEVIRELKKAGFNELANIIAKKYDKFDVRVKYKQVMEIDPTTEEIKITDAKFLAGLIEYVKRRPTHDIAKYFNFEDNWKEILEKYDPEWILHVFDYPNKTTNLGVLANPRRYGIEDKKEDFEDFEEFEKSVIEEVRDPIRKVIDDIYGEPEGEIIRRGIPAEAIANYLSEKHHKFLVETRIGNQKEYWLYIKNHKTPKNGYRSKPP